jgi:hypothetical protein
LKTEIPTAQVQNTFEENPDLEELRRRFESEQNIDGFDQLEEPVKNTSGNTEAIQSKNNENYQNQIQEEQGLSIQKSNRNKWHQLLNLAETSVQMISHYDGYKIYHSIM